MHVTYILHLQEKEFLSGATLAKINAKKATKKDIQTTMRQLELQSQEYAKEKAEIYGCAVMFGVFLKKNAIVPYNDTFEQYMNMLIYDEESKDERIKDANKIEQLQNDKRTYLQKKELLEETLKRGSDDNDDTITPEKISELKEKLMKLEHNGKQLTEILSKY